MKKILITTCILIFCFSASKISAQNCKPDSSGQDKISKQQVDQWYQSLFSTGFGSSIMSSSQISVIAMVGRYGTKNSISIQIQKSEESKQNATFESQLRAVKGNQFYFGFKNGEPLTFEATEVSNSSKVGGLLVGQIVTTVVLAATVSDKDLATLKDALTQKQIDSVRIVLAGDFTIEKNVKDKESKKMMEKFGCFYQSLDKRGINLSSDSVPQNQNVEPVAKSGSFLSGKYVRKVKQSDYINLSNDGVFEVHQEGKDYTGKYTIEGNTLIMTSPPSKKEIKSQLNGDSIVDADGEVWEKLPMPKSATTTQLTIEQIIDMVKAKLSDDIIITTIQKSGSKFDLTPDALIKLKTAGVSDAIIRTMMM
jgi:Zn/Cd-binding protein ZinT